MTAVPNQIQSKRNQSQESLTRRCEVFVSQIILGAENLFHSDLLSRIIVRYMLSGNQRTSPPKDTTDVLCITLNYRCRLTASAEEPERFCAGLIGSR